MKNIPKHIIVTLLLLSCGISFVEIALNLKGQEVSSSAQASWGITFAILMAVWVKHDARNNDFGQPFSFGLFLYLFLPFLLPYYLYNTRGLEGLVTFVGFSTLYCLPFFSGLMAYIYFA
ncbi:MAG: hypothetical protein ACJA2B_001805 [Candidatus Endobugula sp.]|jgi:hypothetical protein